ncbi:MAG TPA: bifunctional DNA-formamidopyrimidine glycosylase/DNA-(apurinic or apyrimidinic site) lyase [Rhizomicrobium sp.]|nr:bifunctional DNA-formamidopyrimidine glycosylase/DNA-(apurinic or apyrimidinic site) lyase [Rhizomicrobium sp.]
MPELPEVETVRLGLRPALEGRTILEAQTRRGDLRVPFPPRFAERLTGRKVKRLVRRAKYIVAELDSGESLVIHLGMSGRISVYAEGKQKRLGDYVYNPAPPDAGHGKHDHVVIETDAPAKIVFNDHRRFGLMTLVPTDQLDHDKLFKDIGIEPLSEKFNAKYLTHALDGKKTSIKAALLDQRVVAGLGNIYVSEALFLAHISPKKLAGAVKKEQIAALVKAIKAVLKDAIAAGGSTLRDHAQATGDPGSFQHRFRVYGREGMPCRNTRASSSEAIGHQKKCRGTVKRIVQGGRSTFYCPACQK